MAKFGIGQPIRRVEDQRFVTGHGQYTDDIKRDDEVFGFVLRSPEAHARIRGIDLGAAQSAQGVLAIFTGADIEASGGNQLPCLVPLKNHDGSSRADVLRPVLATDRVRHVGDNVAFVVAETLAQARDAAELIEVDYESLPAVTDMISATDDGAPLVYDHVKNNLAFDWQYGDQAAVDSAFESAAHVTRVDIVNNRVVANPMEPRAIVAEWDDTAGKLTAHVCTQGGWAHKSTFASILGIPEEQVRVVTPDVGGGFGMKIFFYPEYGLAAWAARALKRPVRWTAERSADGFVADCMGRDHLTHAELALDSDHRILGMRVETRAGMGAYINMFAPFIPTGAALKVLPGVYDVKKLAYRVKGVLTNTTPIDAYRGAGRPESIYLMERLIDAAARDVGLEPTELRRKNFIQADAMPFETAAGETYDTGEFARVMDTAMEKAGWPGFDQRRADSQRRGRLRGIGMCYYIESTMGNPEESADIRFEEDGTVSVLVGTQSNGQGHETAYAQVLNERLGVPFEQIRIIQGDTDQIPMGGGTGGSRSLTAEAYAIREAAEKVIERGKAYAAQEFEASLADIEFARDDGVFRVKGTDRSVSIIDLAAKARQAASPGQGIEGGLSDKATTSLAAWTFPNGCHIAEVEIDPETGMTDVVKYTVVDDFGVVVNPLLVEGQVHGGVVQGIGQALMEHAIYDEAGQLVSGSFMDYCMPRADNTPFMSFSTVEVPCKNNPFGIKGCGEAGTVGACAAVMNAVVDALEDVGVRAVDMPATPSKVWQLLHGATPALAAE
ncbi:MAG: xanthine dehydrogenase family protein molybdopterin-binding subunit [Geminicoccaceae bacterium]|nr:xanthine dehydrogenase family protein molybdopterin-binding subunit [Geminicoccaceae bacterium]